MRIAYRARQFWHALYAKPNPNELALACAALPGSLMILFDQLQPSEQAHGLKIYRQLVEQGETQPDLLVAALLHDAGKSRYRLHVWDRVLIVLARATFPQRVHTWGLGSPTGWQRAFVIAEQHPAWGAEMAAQAGASSLAVTIIRRHQDFSPEAADFMASLPLEDQLLYRLKILDDDN